MNRHSNPVFDCSGARLRAQSRQLATVVSVSGQVHDDNIDRITEHARRYVLAATSVVLDLSGVTSFDDHDLCLLQAFDSDCAAAGQDWVLVPSETVLQVLGHSDEAYPIAETVSEALSYFADETLRRRTLLLPLLTRSA
ncbi:STAS domain-containing protein [Mycobacterium sp. ACS4331]|uniref:STAS domain-containing protein n=1 Tax=Mycobacterium sp. ACS4331 TaxID=1834121 RepID=UPI0009EE5BAC|nr:STAS domain-containing protein [Mycobacterium sp. ACS4331]